MLTSMEELAQMLAQAQRDRVDYVRCELSCELSAKVSDATLVEALITGLPMAQGIQHRILRSRGRGAVFTAKVRWREGVRMLAGERLTAREEEALALAREIAEEVSGAGEECRFCHVYDWLCQNVAYVHTAPGQKGYEQLVCASGALLTRQANCQGFADALYLLCGLCGVPCEYRCGRGQRRLHVWNAVRIDGQWREADASKGARSRDY
ncbi:MAG: hypothetical protein IJA83_01015 [Clostridia bacterium]|nr:hypothetical protein [Clostridia bacterium]